MNPDRIDQEVVGVIRLDARSALREAVDAAAAAEDRAGRCKAIADLLDRVDLLPGLAQGCEGELARLQGIVGGKDLVASVRRAATSAARELRLKPSPVLRGGDQPEADVWDQLDLVITGDGDERREHARKTLSNAEIVLSHDTRWKGRLRLNDFSGLEEMDGESIRDTHATAIHLWLDRVYGLDLPTERVSEAIGYVAAQTTYHPVREYLRGLAWDGTERLPELLSLFHAEDTPLNRRLGRAWLVSAVARIMDPGCQVDTTLILVGPQGCGKSKAIRVLAGPGRSADTILDLQSKDLFENIQGVWLYELAELDSFRRTDWNRIKALLSSPEDRWRRPYGHRSEPRKRQVVFVGTTNDAQFLGDPTGSRRFWPVRVDDVDLVALGILRDQLWAEAVHRYNAGEPWHLTGDEVREAAEAADVFSVEDPWEAPFARWIDGRVEFTIAEVLEGAMGRQPSAATRTDHMHAANVLQHLGCHTSRKARRNGAWVRLWRQK